MMKELRYQSGFGNFFETEALPGILPEGQNSPQKVARGLYAEQISGSAFSALRSENLRTWTYRILPSALQSEFRPHPCGLFKSGPFNDLPPNPTQFRWDPYPWPQESKDFLESLMTVAGNGHPNAVRGMAVHLYAATRSMENRFFYNADGHLLFVPEQGRLLLATELGLLALSPGEIAVIPRGIRFQVQLPDGKARGYVCENYGQPFRLPYLGLIGSNGLANPRDFLAPVASFVETSGSFELVAKYEGGLWVSQLGHSPLDVVAWHGNYVPYKYDLARFSALGSVTFDHPDPSLLTVLTSPSEAAGVANVDFVIFPTRWSVAEHTFRPPWFHRNIMSEYMGLLFGKYDAKEKGLVAGGGTLHNCMTAHGPDAEAVAKATTAELKPHKPEGTLAFMFETSLPLRLTSYASTHHLQKDYLDCWKDLRSNFKTTN
jgi:homogentisate 1,2-dioxygenase